MRAALASCRAQILLTYARGSAGDGRRWAVPSLGWLGLCKADFEYYGLPASAAQAVSAADVRKARSLLDGDEFVADDASPLAAALRDELAAFAADGGEKMELEGLMTKGLDFISRVYLPDKLARRDWVGGGGGDGGDDD